MHVMRLGHATAWFSMRPPNPVLTPRADEFSWAERRASEPNKAARVSSAARPAGSTKLIQSITTLILSVCALDHKNILDEFRGQRAGFTRR